MHLLSAVFKYKKEKNKGFKSWNIKRQTIKFEVTPSKKHFVRHAILNGESRLDR